jgi:hypothetical protein
VSLFAQWEQVLWQLDRVLRSVQGEPGFGARVDELVQRIEALTLRDPDIAIYLTVRRDPERLTIYAPAHSVRCAMVALLMARRLGWDDARTHTLMKAALTLNIAMLDLQGRMAAQGVPATPPQMDLIRVHPAQGVEMLKAAGVEVQPGSTPSPTTTSAPTVRATRPACAKPANWRSCCATSTCSWRRWRRGC